VYGSTTAEQAALRLGRDGDTSDDPATLRTIGGLSPIVALDRQFARRKP